MNTIIRGVAARWVSRPLMVLVVALAVGAGLAAGPATAAAALPAQSPLSMCPAANVPAFGPNVCVFNDTMSLAAIQADLNNIAGQQVPIASQFDGRRYAIFFQPGTYGSASDPLIFQVGYYTTVAGLGLSPGDVVINGEVNVSNQCVSGSCTGLDNFWRSLSNLTINVTTGTGCQESTEFWAASQASPLRPHRGSSDPRSSGSRQARPGPEWTTTQIAWTGSSVLFRYSCGVEESNAIESPGPSS